ncbi:MAG: arylamine N-acetyltransferase [Umezawaea sp.]
MPEVLEERLVDAYLAHIGAQRPQRADVAALRHLQERHVLSVPFETIAFYTREPVPHSTSAVRKIVDQRRGGSCFELNSAFALLLRALGYELDILQGRIYRNSVLDSRPGHMALRVRTPGLPGPGEVSWLVDVGQGRNSRYPLRLDAHEPQEDPHGTYLLVNAPEGDVDVLLDGNPIYRMESRVISEEYGEATVWWYLTSPKSPFVKHPICILPDENGRRSLVGNTLISEVNGRRTVRKLTTDAELLMAYKANFGIELDQVPQPSDVTPVR